MAEITADTADHTTPTPPGAIGVGFGVLRKNRGIFVR
jgi:hypothetical protein